MKLTLGLAVSGLLGLAVISLISAAVLPIPHSRYDGNLFYVLLAVPLLGLLLVVFFSEHVKVRKKEFRSQIEDVRKSLSEQIGALAEKMENAETAVKASIHELAATLRSEASALGNGTDTPTPSPTLASDLTDGSPDVRSEIGRGIQDRSNGMPNAAQGAGVTFEGWCAQNVSRIEDVIKNSAEGPGAFNKIEPRLRDAGVLFSRACRFEESNMLAVGIDRGELLGQLILFPAPYFPLKEYARYFEGNIKKPDRIVRPALIRVVGSGGVETYEIVRQGALE